MSQMVHRFFNRLAQALHKEKSAPITAPKSTASAAGSTVGVGTLLNGRYRLEVEIGWGGMGIVYRAQDLRNQRNVAIKVINFDKANALTREQFLHEAEITARLMHPHLVSVYEIGTVDAGAQEPLPFIVMELVHGTGLDEMHRLTFSRILAIGKQICEALEYVHRQGLVYRDLKPSNVLIEKRGFQYFVKLTDFGLARPRGMAYAATESYRAGTLFYLAPELIAGQPADILSDLYALGATLYEMITGRVPFSDFDEEAILTQHREASVVPPSDSRADVPPALEAIVLRLLAKKPLARFDSAQEVRQALEQVAVHRGDKTALNNLPEGVTADVGREDQVVEVIQLLESNSLVTLLGDGERLELAVGSKLADQFEDGVRWIDLASVPDPALVLKAVASNLNIRLEPQRSLTVSLIEFLREKNLLLLLNRCGPVRGACAQLAETILHTCPDVRILATSDQALNTSAEKCYSVGL